MIFLRTARFGSELLVLDRSPVKSARATLIVPAFVSLRVMLVIFVKVDNAPSALRLVLILAAVSLMTVPAGISPVKANTCAAVSGTGAVKALATVIAAADTFTVLLLLVVMVAEVGTVVFTAVVAAGVDVVAVKTVAFTGDTVTMRSLKQRSDRLGRMIVANSIPNLESFGIRGTKDKKSKKTINFSH